jgi:hypothetical protein
MPSCGGRTRSSGRRRRISPRRSSTAERSDGGVHRRPPGGVRGRADLCGAADRPVGVLRAPGAGRRSRAASPREPGQKPHRSLWCDQDRSADDTGGRACGLPIPVGSVVVDRTRRRRLSTGQDEPPKISLAQTSKWFRHSQQIEPWCHPHDVLRSVSSRHSPKEGIRQNRR